MHSDVWTYRDASELGTNIASVDISGFQIEALDGSIGKVDDATFEAGSARIVVDTGPWIFGKKVLLPAGVVRSIDEGAAKLYVNRTKDEIKHAPEFDDSMLDDDSYRSQVASYYGKGGSAHRDWDDV